MTKQEAIAELKAIKSFEISEYGEVNCEETLEALDMAIEALNAQKSGVWKVYRDCEGKQTQYECPFCDMSETYFAWKPKYCDSCGARLTIPEMEEAADEP